jgi:hypothetical protein
LLDRLCRSHRPSVLLVSESTVCAICCRS